MLDRVKKHLKPLITVAKETVVEPLLERGLLKANVERQLSHLEAAPKRCGTCRNFNLEAGQTAIRHDPTAMAILGSLTPDQVIAANKKAVNEDGELDESAANTDLRPGKVHSWAQYGACSTHRELVHEDAKKPSGQPCGGKGWL